MSESSYRRTVLSIELHTYRLIDRCQRDIVLVDRRQESLHGIRDGKGRAKIISLTVFDQMMEKRRLNDRIRNRRHRKYIGNGAAQGRSGRAA